MKEQFVTALQTYTLYARRRSAVAMAIILCSSEILQAATPPLQTKWIGSESCKLSGPIP